MIIFILLFVAVCGVLVIYPYVIYPRLLKSLPSKPIARKDQSQITASLLFCAFNEGRAIPEKLANLAALKVRYPSLQVLAYDDGSSDNTCELLQQSQELLTVVKGEGRSGKASGMKRLAKLAHGDILIFTDANVLLDEEAIDKLAAWYADPTVGGVCGTLKYLGDDESATATVGGAYWRLEERIKSEESRTGNVMGADGSIFSIRREIYPDFPDTVLDDLTVSMAVVFAGKRLIKADDVVAYERLVTVRKEEFARKVRISARAYHTHMHLRAQLRQMDAVDRFKYSSRKFLRWFGGLYLVLGVLSSIIAASIMSTVALVVLLLGLFGFFMLGMFVRKGVIGAVAEIILALFATMLGVIKAMRGQTVVTWSPAKSR